MDDSSGSEDEPINFPSVIQLLISSGRLQLIRDLVQHEDDFEDSSEEGFMYRPATRRRRRPCPPPAAAVPITAEIPSSETMQGHDLERVMMTDCGESCAQRHRTSVPQELERRRRVASCCSSVDDALHFQRRLACHYLPNKRLKTLTAYSQKLFCGVFSRSGDVFLSACQDQNIRIFDTAKGQFKLRRTVQARDVGWSVLDLALSPDAHHIVYSTWSPNLEMFSLASELHYELPLNPAHDRFCVFSLAFSRNGAEVLGGANFGDLYCYDLESHQRVLRVAFAHEDDLNAVAFADDTSQIFFSGGDDGLLKCWDRRTLGRGECESGEPVGVFAGHHDGITFLDSKMDGRYVISNSKDQSIKLWDLRRFAPARTQEAACRKVAKQGWDYRWQAVPKKMKKEERLDGDPSVMTYKGHEVRYTLMRARFSPVFSTGQRYIYAGSAGSTAGAVLMWDVLSGQIVRRIEVHRNCVRDVSWHPWDLQRMVTSSWDGTHAELSYQEPAMAEEMASAAAAAAARMDDSDGSQESLDQLAHLASWRVTAS